VRFIFCVIPGAMIIFLRSSYASIIVFSSAFSVGHTTLPLYSFEMNPESVICPYKQFYAIATVIAKCKNYFIPWVKLKLLTYDF
jgi:hypothetical protein